MMFTFRQSWSASDFCASGTVFLCERR